jgi:hypothetical protein
VERIIDSYVHQPRLLRNKIAHGQWFTALNRNNTAINKDLTEQLNNIDIVKLNIWKDAYGGLSNIIETLIESPDRAFHRDYWVEIVKVEEQLKKTEDWNLETKIKMLRLKASHHKK